MSILGWAAANTKLTMSILGSVGIFACGSTAFSSYSSAGNSYEYLFRYVPEIKEKNQSWAEVMDGKEFREAKLVKHSYKKIIKGDNSYNGGNYIVYYGSKACPHCTKFMFNNLNIAYGNTDLSKHKMSHGAWMKAFAFTREDETLKKIKIRFIMFEDIPDKNKSAEDDIFWTLPWRTYEYDNESKGIKKGQLIRQDKSARDLNRIMETSKGVFGEEKVPGTPTVIVYKKGKPLVFNQDSLEQLQHEKQDESISNENILMSFIKHYYTKAS